MKKLTVVLSYLAGYHAIILMYHSITDADVPQDPWAVSESAFTSQMEWLKRNRYNVMSLSEIVDNIVQNKKSRNCVALTFDDGYVDFLKNAAPILQTYGFPATLFVPAGMIGGTSLWDSFDTRKPILSWNGMRELVQLGCTIGSHGMLHTDLTKLSSGKMTEEVADSKKKLEAELGISVGCYSYPFGEFTERESNAVKQTGYSCAVTTNSRCGNSHETNLFKLERIAVSGNDSLVDFKLKVSVCREVFKKFYEVLLGSARV